MIAGIIGVPSRMKLIEENIKIIGRSVDRIEVFLDEERRGNWWNSSRAVTNLTAKARPSEPVMFLTDDAVTVPDWRERWEQVHHEAKNTMYTMFTRQKHLFTPENVKRGWVTKCQARGWYDVAWIVIDRPSFMQDVMEWFEHGGRELPSVKPRARHLDVVIQEYLIAHQLPWTITVPTLFDHRPVKSTLGHAIGQSPWYVGGKSPL